MPMMKSEELRLNARQVPNLQAAIDQWLAARDAFKSQPRDENRNEYNSTYFALGVAFNERYPEGAATPGAFEWYRRGLIAPEEE
jgi:hypothetical protein